MSFWGQTQVHSASQPRSQAAHSSSGTARATLHRCLSGTHFPTTSAMNTPQRQPGHTALCTGESLLVTAPDNPASRYRQVARFTHECTGTERLTNKATVTQLVTSEGGILAPTAKTLTCVKCRVRGWGGGECGPFSFLPKERSWSQGSHPCNTAELG